MMTAPIVARAFCASLFGDAHYLTPEGTGVAEWFMTLPETEAFKEYHQMRQLPEGFRPRDVMERMKGDTA